jgi:hypothetical protein
LLRNTLVQRVGVAAKAGELDKPEPSVRDQRSESRGVRGERSMKAKCLAGAMLLVAFATPVLADSYYVVQDTATKKCTVVTQKPTTTTTTVVGGDKVYTSQTEADSAMKTITVCQSN